MREVLPRPKRLDLKEDGRIYIKDFASMNTPSRTEVVAFMGRAELDVDQLREIRDWCTRALDYLHSEVSKVIVGHVQVKASPEAGGQEP